MPRFAYKARDRGGQLVDSAIEAPSRKDAVRLLSARGLEVASVSESSPAGAGRAKPARAQAAEPREGAGIRPEAMPRQAERLAFLESLHDLTTSGLSAGEAVRL